MSRRERAKGAAGELEVAKVFRQAGFDCDRVPNSGGLRLKGDLYGNIPLHVEVKRQETLRLPTWLRQAEAECGELVPVVCFRQNRGVWYAALPLEDLAALMRDRRSDPSDQLYSPDATAALEHMRDDLLDAARKAGQ